MTGKGKRKMKGQANSRGVTLIELMVVLVICCMLVGGIYRLFIAQSKAYTVQEQVVEVQQSTRAAMEILLRDLRMTGYDDDRTQAVTIPNPPVVSEDHAITVNYEYNNVLHQLRYWRDPSSRLLRQETVNGVSTTEVLLETVDALDFTYGVDENDDGAMDDRNGNGILDDWVPSASVGNLRVVAVRASLTARPAQVNPDLQQTSPRTLISAVTFRNLSLMR
jgi:prepilin-type N-terminal cleavage/methylation domain-containing protein